MTRGDEHFMELALEQARSAEQHGEVPVGAVLVAADGDTVIGAGRNSPIESNDPSAHAEINAMRAAAAAVGNYRLTDTTLYVTLEPCAMCAGAMVHARIARLVYGCSDQRGGAAGTIFNIAQSDELNHRVEVSQGVLAEECRELLQSFFRARR